MLNGVLPKGDDISGYSTPETLYATDSESGNSPLRVLQNAELDILKRITAICERESIRCYAVDGTLLGAIRHRGFIPWDDDIDVGVPRPDYEKLLRILPGQLTKGMVLRSYKSDSGYDRFYARVENTTVKVTRNDGIVEEDTHAWVDLFPIDGMPNNRLLRLLRQHQLLFLRAMTNLSTGGYNPYKSGRRPIEILAIRIGARLSLHQKMDTKRLLKKIEGVLGQYDYDSSEYVVNFMSNYKFKEMVSRNYYDDSVEYPFEDSSVVGPRDYDYICRRLYGDYMTPPPPENRAHHHIKSITTE